MTRVDAQYAECNKPVNTKKKFINVREVSARLVLTPGDYVVIPATFNRGEQGRHLVRLFIEQHRADSRPVGYCKAVDQVFLETRKIMMSCYDQNFGSE